MCVLLWASSPSNPLLPKFSFIRIKQELRKRSDTKHIKYWHAVALRGAQMGASAAAGAKKTDPNSAKRMIVHHLYGPIV